MWPRRRFLEEFIADKILIADKYWKYVLQRILDIIEKIDGVQDGQIEKSLGKRP